MAAIIGLVCIAVPNIVLGKPYLAGWNSFTDQERPIKRLVFGTPVNLLPEFCRHGFPHKWINASEPNRKSCLVMIRRNVGLVVDAPDNDRIQKRSRAVIVLSRKSSGLGSGSRNIDAVQYSCRLVRKQAASNKVFLGLRFFANSDLRNQHLRGQIQCAFSCLDDIRFYPNPARDTLPNVLGIDRKQEIHLPIVSERQRIFYANALEANPWSLLAFKDALLALDGAQLPAGIRVTDYDGKCANGGGGPQSINLRVVPPTLAFFVGSVLIGLAMYLLNRTLYRSDFLMYVGMFGGFVPFLIGFALVLFCFLTGPPSIFGFTIGHW